MKAATLHLPPVVISELLSDRDSSAIIEVDLGNSPMLLVLPGFWQRAGATRRILLEKGLRAKIPDALIAQSCIDHDAPLITRDPDFRHFAKYCGLRLA